MNVLHICANPKPIEESACKQLAAAFFAKLVELDPEVDLTNVDLYQDPPPFLSYPAIRGSWFPAYIEGYTATKEELAQLEYADLQADAFNSADVVVLTLPMWNYSVPAILKAWIDQVFTPGRVFEILKGKGILPKHKVQKLVLLVASGGSYKEGDARDALTTQIEGLFAWIGIRDISTAWAEGQDTFLFDDCEQRKQNAREAAEEIAEEVAALAVSS